MIDKLFGEIIEGAKKEIPTITPFLKEFEKTQDDTLIREFFQNLQPKGDTLLYQELKEKSPYVVNEKPGEQISGVDGFLVDFILHIFIKKELSEMAKLRVLIHEAAHAVMLHDRTPKEKEIREVEAESIAYLFLKEQGVDIGYYSFPYLVKEAGEDIEALLLSQKDEIIKGLTELKEKFQLN